MCLGSVSDFIIGSCSPRASVINASSASVIPGRRIENPTIRSLMSVSPPFAPCVLGFESTQLPPRQKNWQMLPAAASPRPRHSCDPFALGQPLHQHLPHQVAGADDLGVRHP